MPETLYTVGKPGEMGEIIDFINYVFSQAHVPHDFKALLPKVYGDDAPEGQEAFHHLAKQGDKIVSCIACRPTELIYGNASLKCGFVGSVSVHPYHRGEGHMKRLMADVLAEAREKGYDMLILGGQRQRYGYFGFEKAGYKLNFDITKTNVRHALANVDASGVEICPMKEDEVPDAYRLWAGQPVRAARTPESFFEELKSWKQTPLSLRVSGQWAGYKAGSELMLCDEDIDLTRIVKALMDVQSDFRQSFSAGLHEKKKIGLLKDICEGVNLSSVELIHVLSWPKVLKALIEFKHKYVLPVNDCAFALEIEGDGTFDVKVKDGCVTVETLKTVPETAVKLSHMEAQRLFFGIAEQYLGKPGIEPSCLGLPFYMSEQDAF